MRVSAHIERWPIAGRFTIARGSKTEAEVVVAELNDGAFIGRGEAVAYARYGESSEQVAAQIEAAGEWDRMRLAATMPPGAARNALDCALWDLEAKRSGQSAAALAGIPGIKPVLTAFTISLATPEEMAAKAAQASYMPLLKLKLGGDGDAERLKAVRAARPDARLVADANEAWRADNAAALFAACAECGLELVEQPFPADDDAILASMERPVAVCADESAHPGANFADLAGRYDAVNIKLDKTGGLTEALRAAEDARRLGLKIMVGCMVSTSLAMAPAMILAQCADWVDLDGPLLLASDREPGLRYDGPIIQPPSAGLWG